MLALLVSLLASMTVVAHGMPPVRPQLYYAPPSAVTPSLESSPHDSSAVTCGLGDIDLSSLTTKGDWLGLATDYTEIYYLSLCSKTAVRNLWCTLNQNTKATTWCQVSPDSPSTTFSIVEQSVNGDAPSFKWAWVNGKDSSDGISLTSASGDQGGCSHPRAGKLTFVCGNTTGVIGDVNESPQCTYNTVVPTPLLCTPSTTTRLDLDQAYVDRVMQMAKRLSAAEQE